MRDIAILQNQRQVRLMRRTKGCAIEGKRGGVRMSLEVRLLNGWLKKWLGLSQKSILPDRLKVLIWPDLAQIELSLLRQNLFTAFLA